MRIFPPRISEAQTVVGNDGQEHSIGTVANRDKLQPTAANAKGDIVGTDGRDLFLYSGGKVTHLGIPMANVMRLLPVAISESGKVIAQSRARLPNLGTEETAHSYLYDAGKLKEIGSLGGLQGTLALAVNNQGKVVGSAFTGGLFSEHAFVYENVKIKDLNQVAPVPPAWVLLKVDAINDRGQIVCTGMKKNDVGQFYNDRPFHVFLLTPKGMK